MATMVEMAAQQMLDGPTVNDAQDQVFFTGVWNDAYPAILVRDPILPDSAKIQLLYLMQAGRANPYGANPLPSVEKTARDLGKSPTTVVRDRAIIRMARWATQCRRVRDTQGRMRGLVWSMHSEPASLADATALDSEYMGLLEQAAAGHFDRIARRVAGVVLAAIDHDIGEGRDPLEAINPMERRMEALETIRTGHGRCFAGYFIDDKQDSNPETGAESPREQVSKFEASGSGPQKLHSNFEISAGEQVSNLEASHQAIDFSGSSNFETCERSSCSSSINKTTTTTETNKAVTVNSVNSTTRTKAEQRHSSGHQDSVNTVTNLHSGECPPAELRNSHIGATPPCLSNEVGIGHSVTTPPPIDWPPTIDDNRKRLVLRMLLHHLPDRPGDHQEVINALAAKLADKTAPIRDLGNYVFGLCKRVKAGTLCPVEPPAPPDRPRPPDNKLSISNLRGEIGSLQRLIEATRHTGRGNIQALEAQLARRREELRELEQTKH